MTTLAIPSSAGAPPAIDPPLGMILSRRYNGLMGGRVLSSDLELSPDQRLALKVRASRIDESFGPAPEKRALIAISGVLGILSTRNADAGDAATQRRAYWAAVADVPGFAVFRACELALTTGVGDKRFAPTPPELREAALAVAHPFRVERSRIKAVLEAEVAPAPSSSEKRAELAAAARRAFRIPGPAVRRVQSSPHAHDEAAARPPQEDSPGAPARGEHLASAVREASDTAQTFGAAPPRGGMTDVELREARALSEAIRAGTPAPRSLPKFSPELRRKLGLRPEPSPEPACPEEKFGDEHAA